MDYLKSAKTTLEQSERQLENMALELAHITALQSIAEALIAIAEKLSEQENNLGFRGYFHGPSLVEDKR